MTFLRALSAGFAAGLLAPVAHALCTSDGVGQPAAVMERFISADCASCWRDPATPRAAPGTLALDWVVPGRQGEQAPLAAVALPEAQERLAYVEQRKPGRAGTYTLSRTGRPLQLRLAQGAAFNDYVGASIELLGPGRERWRAWLLLVEQLPAGTESSPVPRLLVRNVFRPDWHQLPGAPAMERPAPAQPEPAPQRLAEARSMQIHEGAQAQRLRLVALVHDPRGRLRAVARTECW